MTADEFDESFYATAAQVIPVLLLTLAFQLGLRRRLKNEDLGLSLFMLATALAMTLGELTAFVALAERKNLRPIGDSTIWIALVWGMMLIAAGPILTRWNAVHEAIPLWLSLVVRYALLVSVVTIVFLASFDVVSAEVLPAVGALVVLLFAFAGMAVADFGPVWRRWRKD